MQLHRMVALAAFGVVAALGVAACDSEGGAGTAAASRNQQAAEPASDAGAGGQAQKPAASGPAGPGPGPADQAAQQPVPASQRKVVRTAHLSVEIGDTYDDIYAAARRTYDISARFGGFVADEKTDDTDATIQLRLPGDHLDDALAALADLGKVTSRTQQTQDVTEQVVDVQARMANQRASVERVRALLDRATAIGEIVQIESELTRRQADLESLQQRAATLNGQVELATVSVQLTKPGKAPGPDRADTGFLSGLTAGWRVFIASAEVIVTVLGGLLPFLVTLAIPTVLIVWLRRRRSVAATANPPTTTAPAGQ